MITALAGGVGAARFLRGLLAVVSPGEVTAIVNTGDDIVLHGLHISPDLDTVTYTLAEAVNPETGWGLVGETWQAMDALERYRGATWFRLGDRDLATHLYRTQRRAEGATLTEVTAEIVSAWELGLRVLPMSDDRVETRVTVTGDGDGKDGDGGVETEIGFQEYFVARGHQVPVTSVRFDGVEEAMPGPDVLRSIRAADLVVICPSNPIVSIGPILAVSGIEHEVAGRRQRTVAISPIVAGAALKGPADRMLTELGHEASVVGVARLYAPFAGTLVIDEADADRASAVEDEGVTCVVAPTIMSDLDRAAALAKVVLGS